jgi:hypothetical protein
MTTGQQKAGMTAAINAARRGHGLPPLTVDGRLTRAADGHAADLAAHEGLVHIGSDGRDGGQRAKDAGYIWTQWGEVVGWGWNGDTAMMLNWWMGSLTHRAQVLGVWEHIGVGYYYALGTPWKSYWSVTFGNTDEEAQPVTPAPIPAEPLSPGVPVGPVIVGQGDRLDLLPYLMGAARYARRGPLYEINTGERFQVQRDEREERVFYLTKNSQWEQFAYDDDHIYRGLDTSPGGDRFYVQYEPDSYFARWLPRWMRPGETWTGPGHRVQFYDKRTGQPSAANSGPAVNRATFVKRYDSAVFNGIQIPDVIEVHANGERYWFGRDIGMIAWGSEWGKSAITEMHAPGARPDNVRETLPAWEII